MTKRNELDEAAAAGYAAGVTMVRNPYLATSPNWYAYALGAFFWETGRPRPRDVRMSRGASIRCGDMLFRHVPGARGAFERIN